MSIQMTVFYRIPLTFNHTRRTTHNAKKLVTGIKSWLKGSKDTVLKITTDKLAAYQNAIETVLSESFFIM